MFCKITCSTRSYNRQSRLVAAIAEIATTPAGGTPDDSFIFNTTIDVIDNTTAGGWEIWPEFTNIHPDGTMNGYNTGSYLSRLALYNPNVGKSDYTHVYLSFGLLNSSYINNTNNNGYAYAHPEIHMGFIDSTSTDDANKPNTNSSNMVANFGTQGLVNHGYRPGGVSTSSQSSYNPASAAYAGSFLDGYRDSSATMVYYVIATENMIHIHQGNTFGAWFHFGKRTNQDWEDNFTDNPYWVALWQDYYYSNNDTYPSGMLEGRVISGYYGIMRGLNPTNHSNIAPAKYNFSTIADNQDHYDPLTGFRLDLSTSKSISEGYSNHPEYSTYNRYYAYVTYWTNSSSTSNSYSTAYWDLNQIYINSGSTSNWFKYPMWDMTTGDSSNYNVGYSYDTVSGIYKPTAHQIRVSAERGRNEGGVMKYMLGGTWNSMHNQLKDIVPDSAHGTTTTIGSDTYAQLKMMGNHGVIFVKVE